MKTESKKEKREEKMKENKTNECQVSLIAIKSGKKAEINFQRNVRKNSFSEKQNKKRKSLNTEIRE